MVGEAVQQSPGQAFRAEYLRPLIERRWRSPGSSPASLAEDFEPLQLSGAALRARSFSELMNTGKTLFA